MDILSRWQNLSSSKFIPFQASLELTNRCNERCRHCYIDNFSDDPTRTLSLEQWEIVLKKLRKAGTLYLILMGGEAMLNPHFEQILALSSKLGFYTSLITNGLKINTLEVAQRLKNLGLKQVTFSVYSLSSPLHDSLTQVPGSLDRTLSALHWCQEAGLEVGVNSLQNRETIEDFPRLFNYFRQMNIDVRDDITITSKFSGDLAPTKLRVTHQQLIKYYRFKKSLSSGEGQSESNIGPGEYVCNVAKGKCAVTAYGELLGCIEVRDSLGSLVTQEFDELWQSDKATGWREIKNKDLTGAKQDVASKCNHCLGMARNEHADHLKVLDYSLTLHEAHQQVMSEGQS